MTRLENGALQAHPHSICDPNGRVFLHGGRLFRGLRAGWMPVWERLRANGLLTRLVEVGLLVETVPSEIEMEGFAAVVEHRRIPFLTYPHEWPSAALYDAAVCVVDLIEELGREGLMLQDGHLGNVLLDRGRPVYIDLTSIIDAGEHAIWPSYGEFEVAAVYPLVLYKTGVERIARMLAWVDEGVFPGEVEAIAGRKMLERCSRVGRQDAFEVLRGRIHGWMQRLGFAPDEGIAPERVRDGRRRFIRRVRGLLADLQSRPGLEPVGSDRAADRASPALVDGVAGILERERATTVLCAGAAMDDAAEVLAERGFSVVAASGDDARCGRLFRRVRERRRPVWPVVLDLARPTPGEGVGDFATTPAAERLACDFVWVDRMAATFVRDRRLSWSHFARAIGAFARCGAIVTEADPGEHGRDRSGESSAMLAALRETFGEAEAWRDSIAGSRVFVARRRLDHGGSGR